MSSKLITSDVILCLDAPIPFTRTATWWWRDDRISEIGYQKRPGQPAQIRRDRGTGPAPGHARPGQRPHPQPHDAFPRARGRPHALHAGRLVQHHPRAGNEDRPRNDRPGRGRVLRGDDPHRHHHLRGPVFLDGPHRTGSAQERPARRAGLRHR